jgi:DNA-binding NtrC family response regulator
MPLVLVIEDHVDTLELVTEMLTRLSYRVVTAATAAQAEERVREHRPDAILLDIKLPDASGTVCLERLRTLLPNVPIIMLTGNTDAVVARNTLQRGAFDYIMKPFDADRLKSVLQAALPS